MRKTGTTVQPIVTATCSVCGKSFSCPANQAPRRESCTPSHSGPRDNCCSCKLRKLSEAGEKIEFMSEPEILSFLRIAKKEVGIGFYLAFRLAINGMLKPRDLELLKVSDLKLFKDEQNPTKPCLLKVGKTTVELDCDTLSAVEGWTQDREAKGRIFPFRKWTLRRAFKKTLKLGNIYEYTMHALRHTGIMLRVRCAKNLIDMEAIRKAARLHSLISLQPYLTKENSNLLEHVRFVK